MHRSGNPRFDGAVSTRGTRRSRVDLPSSEGVVLISPPVDKNRKAGASRFALSVITGVLLTAAASQGLAQTSPAMPALTPVALPADQSTPAPAVAAPVAPPVPQTEIQARLERSGLAVAGE